MRARQATVLTAVASSDREDERNDEALSEQLLEGNRRLPPE